MRSILKKSLIPAAVIIVAVLLIGLSAFLSGIHRGRYSAVTATSESVTALRESETASIADILTANKARNILLPEKYANEKPLSVTTKTCKQYTETVIRTENGTITVRDNNYPYLVEDERIKIDDSAVKISHNNIDYFITDDLNGACTVLYYKDAVKYTITMSCTAEEMIDACGRIIDLL